MANGINARYQPGGLQGEASESGAPASDPLAELARLIGQEARYFESTRTSRGPAPAPSYDEQDQHEQDVAPPEQHAEPFHDPRAAAPETYDAGYDDRQSSDREVPQPAMAAASRSHYAPPRYAAPEPYVEAAAHYEQEPAEGLNQSAYADAPGYPGRTEPGDYQEFVENSEQMPPLYLRQPHVGSMPPPLDEDFYDEAPRSGRKGLVTVAAVLALAVVGSAGAYGYRTVFGHSKTTSAPPIIHASAEPTKVAPPPPANNDPSANKISYDRFGDRGQNEQVVPREEQPVDMRDVMRASTPPVLSPPVTATASVGNPPSVLTEPKRVRTVPIRPDQLDMAQRPQTVPAATARPTVTATASANAPLDVSPSAAPARAPHQTANAPLSLSPQPGGFPPPPQQKAVAPTRVASAPSGQGRYLVQVSSQRSEADAQTSYRNIKSKYASVLGDQPSTIRRADLGTKGTYYRAMVGPFQTREAAIHLCVNLKAAGGACVVQGN